MNLIRLFVIFILILTLAPCELKAEGGDVVFNKLIKNTEFQKADYALTQVYVATVNSLEPDLQGAMRESQRKWISSRDTILSKCSVEERLTKGLDLVRARTEEIPKLALSLKQDKSRSLAKKDQTVLDTAKSFITQDYRIPNLAGFDTDVAGEFEKIIRKYGLDSKGRVQAVYCEILKPNFKGESGFVSRVDKVDLSDPRNILFMSWIHEKQGPTEKKWVILKQGMQYSNLSSKRPPRDVDAEFGAEMMRQFVLSSLPPGLLLQYGVTPFSDLNEIKSAIDRFGKDMGSYASTSPLGRQMGSLSAASNNFGNNIDALVKGFQHDKGENFMKNNWHLVALQTRSLEGRPYEQELGGDTIDIDTVGQINKCSQKIFEWAAIARDKGVEPFEKQIPPIENQKAPSQPITFIWDSRTPCIRVDFAARFQGKIRLTATLSYLEELLKVYAESGPMFEWTDAELRKTQIETQRRKDKVTKEQMLFK